MMTYKTVMEYLSDNLACALLTAFRSWVSPSESMWLHSSPASVFSTEHTPIEHRSNMLGIIASIFLTF